LQGKNLPVLKFSPELEVLILADGIMDDVKSQGIDWVLNL